MKALALITGLTGLVIWACRTIGMSLEADPMLPGEIGAVGILMAWSAMVGGDLWRAHHLGQALSRISRPVTMEGVSVYIVDDIAGLACVVGGLRPRTFVGRGLVEDLSTAELRAVLLHEDHHRRTRAPLRGAALHAWARLAGSSSWAQRNIHVRETELECQADRYAMDCGVARTTIARALLKCQPMPFSAGFADHQEARIRALLDDGGETPMRDQWTVPYEWVPIAVTLALWVGCHLP